MSKDDGKDFKFDEPDDEAYADALYREEMKDLRVEKLNQRVAIITILIPCLIGVILFIAYRDLTGKVTEIRVGFILGPVEGIGLADVSPIIDIVLIQSLLGISITQ